MDPIDVKPPPLPDPVEPRPVLPLDYTVSSSRTFRLSFGARILLGFFGYALLCTVLAAIAVKARLSVRTVLGAWLIMTTALFALAIYLRIRYRYSGIGYGMILSMAAAAILAVVGVVFLIVGICFGGEPFRFN